jgi:hypothetical protein
MTVTPAVKRRRRAMIAAYIPEVESPWLTEHLGILLGSLYLFWLKLWSR